MRIVEFVNQMEKANVILDNATPDTFMILVINCAIKTRLVV